MNADQQMIINGIVLAATVIATLWTVMTARLVYAAIGLAVTSALITVLMFIMKSPLAAVFELSVCAGLIPAVFLTAISVARKLTAETAAVRARDQIRRFWPLPVIVVLAGIALLMVAGPAVKAPAGTEETNVRVVLWNIRHIDVLGQIIMLLAGAFAVIIFLKEARNG